MVRIETRLVHESSPADPLTGSVVPPLYATSTYRQEGLGKHKGWEYGRTGNPTRAVLEAAMAQLEGATAAFAFASGMAAIDTTFHLLQHGDHVVAAEETYGGTRRILDQAYAPLGVEVTYVSGHETDSWARAVQSNTRMFFLETPSNPLIHLTDIRAVARIAREQGALVALDNTFASPYLQRPIEFGADIVLHSATKYLGGHSDLLAGIAAVKGKKLAARLAFLQNAIGGIASPWDSWLVLRGLKTLHLRMEASSKNAFALAQRLEDHPRVARVHYPGLKSHPQYALARRQMRRPGAMLSFETKGGAADAKRLLRSVGSLTLAESLGSVETLLCHPWSMTHASIPEDRRRKLGITPGLIRVSTGIEHVDDLWADVRKLLAR